MKSVETKYTEWGADCQSLQESSFQKGLADLINKPIAEDIDLQEFNIPIIEPEWFELESTKLLLSGSSVEIIFQTSS